MSILFGILIEAVMIAVIVLLIGFILLILNAILEDCFGLEISDLIEWVRHKIRKGGDSHELGK